MGYSLNISFSPGKRTRNDKLRKKDQILAPGWWWYCSFSIWWIWERLPGYFWYIIGCSIIRAIDCTSLFFPANEPKTTNKEKRSNIGTAMVVILIIFDLVNLGTFAGRFLIHHWMQYHQGYRLHLFVSPGKRARNDKLRKKDQILTPGWWWYWSFSIWWIWERFPGENEMFSG